VVTQYQNRGRAESFGAEAERYERARPSYPAALVDDLMSERPKSVLDVGCGTGKAGRLFVERGCAVTGVEPDARMAEIARRFGLEVEVSKFEAWDDRGRQFDLVIAGQSWHWVDPSVGPPKARFVLRDGGRLAPFANVGHHEPRLEVALDAIYARYMPSKATTWP
jgi:SAM-dependent methyltransferase